MSRFPRVRRTLPALGAALLLAVPPAAAAPAPDSPARGLPTRVVVHDSTTSPPAVDVSTVRLDASWYWDSTQVVAVRVPGGYRPGQHLTVWFDIDGDPTPEGRFDVRIRSPKKPGGTALRLAQTLRAGGGWGTSGDVKDLRSCNNEDTVPISGGLRVGERVALIGFDVFGCFGSHPAGDVSGKWRAVVRLAKGPVSDTAPSGRAWSRPLRGWEPCDPSGGDC